MIPSDSQDDDPPKLCSDEPGLAGSEGAERLRLDGLLLALLSLRALATASNRHRSMLWSEAISRTEQQRAAEARQVIRWHPVAQSPSSARKG